MSKPANIYAPVRRAATVKKIKTAREPLFSIEYFVCFVSFTMLLYSSVAGTMAIVGFLAPWSLILMKRFFSIPQILHKSWPLLLLPGWAIASVFWSIEPDWTLRASLELTATVVVGVLAAYCVTPKTIISALLCAFLIIACLCVIKGDTLSAIRAHMPVNGIFGSKNAFSAAICTLLLISIAVAVDKGQATLFRLLSIGGIIISPFMLLFGRSADAILAACFAVTIFLSVRFLARFDHKIRLIAVIFIILIGLTLVLILSFAEFSPAFLLDSLGKDSTLTGRTHLWNRAFDFIAERPFLGVGYDAFWRVSNINARELWYSAKVPIGSGFNFHNEFIDAWVGLGVVGFGLVVGFLFTVSKRVLRGIMGSMNAEQYFALLIFSIFLIRSPVESGIFGTFNINMILFCAIWKFFQHPKSVIAQPLGLPSGDKKLFRQR